MTFLCLAQGNCVKKETLTRVFFCEFCRFSKNTFSYRTSLVVASVILLSWLWNHFQSQQQKNKVRFVGSLCGGAEWRGVPVKQVVLGGFWVASDGFCWLRVTSNGFIWFCCFSSYANFTTCRRVFSLLYSRTHVIDRGHSIFLFKARQQEKDYCCLVA